MKRLSFAGIATAVMLCIATTAFAQSTETRLQGAVFDEIEASSAVDVTLVPDTRTYVEVTGTAEELRHTHTKLDGNTLEIYVRTGTIGNNLRNYSATVVVHYSTLNAIEASSAATVKSTQTIKAARLELEASSAAKIDIDAETGHLSAEASSAAKIAVSGTTDRLEAEASSAADIRLYELTAKTANAEASSGASVEVNVSERLVAEASSGASIRYKGSPSTVQKEVSSGGSVSGK